MLYVLRMEQGRLVDRPRNESFITHQALFLHNDPRAKHALPTDIWGPCVQFLREGEFMKWNDGADLFGRHRQT